MNSNTTCPIWGTPASEERKGERDGKFVDSPRAGGKYFISRTAEPSLNSCDECLKVRLTSWLVEQRQLGITWPDITFNTIEDAKLRSGLRVFERANRILKYLEIKTNIIGTHIEYRFIGHSSWVNILENNEINYCNLLCNSESTEVEELEFLLNYLKERGFIKIRGRNNTVQGCVLTIEGYAKLAELEETYAVSSKAFVAMWFHESMDETWEHGIKPAISKAGYEAIRIDQQEHTNKIDDEIIAEIRRSRFVVADFTQGEDGARGGVYYEAGFAYGLGIQVVYSCREDMLEKIHFDTRQYNHIVWKEPEELQDKLITRIAAVIGDGPLMNDKT